MRTVAAIFLLLLSAWNMKSAADRILMRRAVPVNTEEKVWDFSQNELTDRGVRYRLYGDSLMAEIYGGTKQLYELRGDTVRYIGEESRLMRLSPESPLLTSAFGGKAPQSILNENRTGHYCKTFALGQHGSYESSLPTAGILIAGNGYEIPVTAVTERRRFSEWMVSDSLAEAGETIRECVKTRWFTEGDMLPVAFQITENLIFNGRNIKTESEAFILPVEDLDLSDKLLEHIIQKSLDKAEIRVEDGYISIGGEFPPAVSLTLYISNIQGSSLHQIPVDMSDGDNIRQIEIPPMPSGQYILTVSAGTPVSRKVIFQLN